jgi:hypothetical protein
MIYLIASYASQQKRSGKPEGRGHGEAAAGGHVIFQKHSPTKPASFSGTFPQ